MKILSRKVIVFLAVLLVALMMSSVVSSADGGEATYKVTIKNLTFSQPLSPPVAATHKRDIAMFKIGGKASDEIREIAENGNQAPMVQLLSGSNEVTQVIDVGMPLTPAGHVVGDFTDTVSFEIKANPKDRLSLATMLICTNDGFTGLDRVNLPNHGTRVYRIRGYDAGTEENTEASLDIVDPCTALGRAALNGDPNGNNNDGIDTDNRIKHHLGVNGHKADLLPIHNWKGPIALVIVERID